MLKFNFVINFSNLERNLVLHKKEIEFCLTEIVRWPIDS